MISFIMVSLADVPGLLLLARRTFYNSFAEDNTAENMQKYLEEELSMEKLTAEVSDPSTEIYFTEQDGQTAGYLSLHYACDPEDSANRNCLKIERLYVRNEFQGMGIGQEMLNFAVEKARIIPVDYLCLGVWERNYRAIRFYEKNGFVQTGTCIFVLGEEVQTDLVMKKYLEQP